MEVVNGTHILLIFRWLALSFRVNLEFQGCEQNTNIYIYIYMYILLFTCEIYLYTYLISIYFNNITYIYIYYRHIYIYIYLHVYRSSVPSQSKISQPKKQFFGNAKTGDFASGNPGTKNSLVKYEHVPRWLLKLFQQCDAYNCNDKIYIYIFKKKKHV